MQTEKMDRSLDNVVPGPYVFKLKDGTALTLDEWTISAERWAKAHFGSMKNLYSALLRETGDDDASVDAAIQVAAYKLDDDSRRIVTERKKEGESTEQFLARNLKYSDFAALCTANFSMIRDSMPLELLDQLKKKLGSEGVENLLRPNPQPSPQQKKKSKKAR